jgi:peptidyl-prolyl cis-trans isomerase B (cyclophilin B)
MGAFVLMSATAVMVGGCGSSATPTATGSAAPPGPSESASPVSPSGGSAAKQITFTINGVPVVVRTDPKAAPRTVASMTELAGDQYFDGTICHRVVTKGILVLQCGDPTGTGTGGPGYTVPEENLPGATKANYPQGTVAMANAGSGTTGSQFFIVYKDTTLPPNYTIWGDVTSGLDQVQAIAAQSAKAGVSDGAPAQPVTIETATPG